MLEGILTRLKCLSGNHEYVPNRAENREPGGYTRYHHDDGGREEPIPACDIVERCRHCGTERRIYAAVDHAERWGVPKVWNQAEAEPEADT